MGVEENGVWWRRPEVELSAYESVRYESFHCTSYDFNFVGERSGNYKVEEGQCNTGTSGEITCADVAEFMLKTLESDEYDRKGFAIAGFSKVPRT